MTEAKQLVKCLRCISTPGGDMCESCCYLAREEVDFLIPIPPDVIIDGKPYWETIDDERIMQDAAQMIETLLE